ncbi:hypothetical protein EGM87_11955 [Sphingobium sp. RSMS]|uniref:hypothetical protein n=1 Tax=Sphingobium sp. RSMS TaxID=520734 RepID=UPI0010F7D1F8|nr:hypothetical protein [Sphingobium sp. RSMS]UXC89774.1 hypothetical protein EGM87_11955 [Sphingobium sp. RSMS]
MDRVSLLICGQLRDRAGFERDLERYLEWRRRGAVVEIVFSGWTSDLGAHRDLLQAMAAEGIDVVLSEEPLIKSFGYTLHQAKNLHYGLSRIHPDNWVLKSRTDKVALDFDIEDVTRRITAQRPVGKGSPLFSRLLVTGVNLFQPFFVNDMMFAGRARDLRSIAHHDLWYVRNHCLLNTEQILFFSPFRQTSPCAEAFFSVNPGLQHGDPELSKEIYGFLLRNPLYRHALREYVDGLQSSFTIGLTGPAESEGGGISLAGLNWEAMLDMDLPIPGTIAAPVIGLRMGVADFLPSDLLEMPLTPGDASCLATMDRSGTDDAVIKQMRDELCGALDARWPDLPNRCAPEIIQDGIRLISTRISLVG